MFLGGLESLQSLGLVEDSLIQTADHFLEVVRVHARQVVILCKAR